MKLLKALGEAECDLHVEVMLIIGDQQVDCGRHFQDGPNDSCFLVFMALCNPILLSKLLLRTSRPSPLRSHFYDQTSEDSDFHLASRLSPLKALLKQVAMLERHT